MNNEPILSQSKCLIYDNRLYHYFSRHLLIQRYTQWSYTMIGCKHKQPRKTTNIIYSCTFVTGHYIHRCRWWCWWWDWWRVRSNRWSNSCRSRGWRRRMWTGCRHCRRLGRGLWWWKVEIRTHCWCTSSCSTRGCRSSGAGIASIAAFDFMILYRGLEPLVRVVSHSIARLKGKYKGGVVVGWGRMGLVWG